MHTLKGSRFFFLLQAACPRVDTLFGPYGGPSLLREGAPWEEDTFPPSAHTDRRRNPIRDQRLWFLSRKKNPSRVEIKVGKRKKWGYNKNCSSPSFLRRRRLLHSSLVATGASVCVRLVVEE